MTTGPIGTPPGIVIGNIPQKSGAQKTMVWDGTKLVQATMLKKAYSTLTKAQIKQLQDYAALIGKKPSDAKSIWNQMVDGATAAYASGNKVSPWFVLSKAIKQIPSGTVEGGVTTYSKDYSNVADSLVTAAFAKVFGRVPTAAELAEASPFKDAKGNALTWSQALIQAANDPANQETVTYTYDRQGNVTGQKVKPGFDPNNWLLTNLSTAYSDAIISGKKQAEMSVKDQYNKLAREWGMNVIDPRTKTYTANSLVDLANLETGKTDLATIRSNFAKLAAAKYPHLATVFDSGVSPYTVANDAISSISKILERNPDTIGLDDPYVQMYLKGDGKSTMSPYELDGKLKQDPAWPTTKNANAFFEGLATDVLKRFGRIG